MEIGALPPSIQRLMEAQRTVAARAARRAAPTTAPVSRPAAAAAAPKPAPAPGLLSAYRMGPSAAVASAATAAVPQKHLGNFFDQIV